MNSLRQLIDQGIAPVRTTMWGKQEPASQGPKCPCCSIAMYYNNIYGTITNTHAECIGDKVIITGSLINNPREWTKFMERRTYLGVDFNMPFIEWAESLGFTPVLSSMNGAVCIMLDSIKNTIPEK